MIEAGTYIILVVRYNTAIHSFTKVKLPVFWLLAYRSPMVLLSQIPGSSLLLPVNGVVEDHRTQVIVWDSSHDTGSGVVFPNLRPPSCPFVHCSGERERVDPSLSRSPPPPPRVLLGPSLIIWQLSGQIRRPHGSKGPGSVCVCVCFVCVCVQRPALTTGEQSLEG